MAAARVARAIAQLDYMRRSPATIGGAQGHKEWQHFAVLAPEVSLLVNFSCCDDMRGAAAPGDESPRLVVLVQAGSWDGDVETFDAARSVIRGGDVDITLGANRLRFADGRFQITATLAQRPIHLSLDLEPVTMPAFVPSVPMLDGPPLHWVVVPRLRVNGWVQVGARRIVLRDAPAYHDHNWGLFQWGHDVAWEWGFALPDDADSPWCVTFVRLTNRARTLALAHKLLLWRGAELVRVFAEGEVDCELPLDHLQPRQVFKVPRAMALLAPGLATDVPRSLHTRARAGRDWVDCRCDAVDVAQVLIPSEPDLGVTIFNEVSARAHVTGAVGGESLAFSGRSILEFIRYA